ncbi:hypothetical protein S2M10_29390 [Sphingomonas sp. S2M10]|uniref:Bbp19 family protein n=1 Tax=Sphingomonas sp. S2M10 TaxID=2705010 RepID=UPI00145757FD|nr:hypothetical protein [Sphingomonas sp. S2M10]NLS27937.1 hypothetical protein [Sphingomonas sp. S2M10]
MALEHDIEAMARRAEAHARDRSLPARMARRIKLVFKAKTIRAYRAVFLGADGRITSHAARVIADLGAVAKLGLAATPDMPEAVLRDRAGRQTVVLHLLARMDLDGAALDDINKKIRELDQ